MTDDKTKAVLAAFQASYHEHAGPIYDHERMAAEIVRLRALVEAAFREGGAGGRPGLARDLFDVTAAWHKSDSRRILEGESDTYGWESFEAVAARHKRISADYREAHG